MPDDQRPAAPAIVAPRQSKRPQNMRELLADDASMIARLNMVVTKYVPAERMARLAVTAINKLPLLAQCTPVSFMGSLLGATALGLEPNTLKQHCSLIPFKNRKVRRDQNGIIQKDGSGRYLYDSWYECQLMVEYRGFVALFYRNPAVRKLQAEAVFDVDKFEYQEGSGGFLRYTKNLDSEGTQLRGAFCYLDLDRGAESFTILRRADIERSRSRSKAWKDATDKLAEAERTLSEQDTPKNRRDLAYAQKVFDETPWQAFLPGMSSKTAIKQHAKIIDLGDEPDATRITLASDLDGLADAGIIDMEALANPEQAKSILSDNEGKVPTVTNTGDGSTENGAGSIEGEQQADGERRDGEDGGSAGDGQAGDGQGGEPQTDQKRTETDKTSAPRQTTQSGTPRQTKFGQF